ncbi:hypothetical protein BCR42DRAFT_400607 [Absidia repens]|uniref:Uncharacterized protein n=1 Tax=Absidia repens TaxID=90262 RepID=A0A1X2J1A9_9FUNG|nr:hypothetical protein BCR42DRAFT_400607 [Absidia repens]
MLGGWNPYHIGGIRMTKVAFYCVFPKCLVCCLCYNFVMTRKRLLVIHLIGFSNLLVIR